MTTKLDGPLKREIAIDGVDYTLTITPDGMTLTLKGRRKGFEMRWSDLVSGDAAMAMALNASLTANIVPNDARAAQTAPSKKATKRKPAADTAGARRTLRAVK